MTYCETPGAQAASHAVMLMAHAVYFGAAGWWAYKLWQRGFHRLAILPLAGALYAADSLLWHVTDDPLFLAGDGALSIVFLVFAAQIALRGAARVWPAAAPAVIYMPLYDLGGEPVYFTAMVLCGLLLLPAAFRAPAGSRHWFPLALLSILTALAAFILDKPLCGATGIVTGHGATHFFDGWCFFFIMGGALAPHFRKTAVVGSQSS